MTHFWGHFWTTKNDTFLTLFGSFLTLLDTFGVILDTFWTGTVTVKGSSSTYSANTWKYTVLSRITTFWHFLTQKWCFVTFWVIFDDPFGHLLNRYRNTWCRIPGISSMYHQKGVKMEVQNDPQNGHFWVTFWTVFRWEKGPSGGHFWDPQKCHFGPFLGHFLDTLLGPNHQGAPPKCIQKWSKRWSKKWPKKVQKWPFLVTFWTLSEHLLSGTSPYPYIHP